MRTILLLALVFFSLSISAQKIVYNEAYDFRANLGKDEPTARILEDSATKKRLLIVSDKELKFYLLDSNWKLIKKFSKPITEGTVLKEMFYKIVKRKYSQDKWIFIGSAYGGYTRETIDFAAQTHQVQTNIMPGITNIEAFFEDGGTNYVFYYTRDGMIKVSSFSEDLKPNNVILKVSTQLPLAKSKKYEPTDYYMNIEWMKDYSFSNPSVTKKKAQFYLLKDAYAFLLSYDEPAAEMSWYDKKTGSKIKSKLFSLEEEAKGKDFNTAALLYENKVYVFVASKSGGVLGVFDPESGKRLYTKVYTDKDDKAIFNYGPVMYETRPGDGFDVYKNVKEKVEDINMDKFCKEMLKHSCAITARPIDKYGLVISFANHDQKELMDGSSPRSNRSITSSLWYVSTSAGLIFEPGTLTVSEKKITWNEVNKWSEATDKFKKIEEPKKGANEYENKKAFVLKYQYIDNRSYVIYYYEERLKIQETKYDYKLPALFGYND